jgi:RNA polymerase sigma-70 factor (sigma-E family)
MTRPRSTSPGVHGVDSVDTVDLSALYAAHHLGLVRMAVLLVDDFASAEDVVQDAFLALHHKASQLRDPSAALGYLRTSVVNGCRSALRKRRTSRHHLRLAREEVADPPDRNIMLASEHAELLASVRQLSQRQQEVLALRYWSGLSEAEIADALGISRGAVKSNASRALDRLESLMGALR